MAKEALRSVLGRKGYVETTDATPTVIDSVFVDEEKAVFIVARVVGIRPNGVEACAYFLRGAFKRDAPANITQVGVTARDVFEDNAGCDCDFVLNVATQSVDLTVTGVLATDIKWKSYLEVDQI